MADKSRILSIKESVNIVSGKQRLNENVDEAYVDAVIENFCILMDWEVKPEDVIGVAEADGKYIMHIEDGTSFTYDPENDCLVD